MNGLARNIDLPRNKEGKSGMIVKEIIMAIFVGFIIGYVTGLWRLL